MLFFIHVITVHINKILHSPESLREGLSLSWQCVNCTFSTPDLTGSGKTLLTVCMQSVYSCLIYVHSSIFIYVPRGVMHSLFLRGNELGGGGGVVT